MKALCALVRGNAPDRGRRADELAFLKAHECDEAQGYYFSRPVPPEQFEKLLRAWLPAPGLPLP